MARPYMTVGAGWNVLPATTLAPVGATAATLNVETKIETQLTVEARYPNAAGPASAVRGVQVQVFRNTRDIASDARDTIPVQYHRGEFPNEVGYFQPMSFRFQLGPGNWTILFYNEDGAYSITVMASSTTIDELK